MNSENEVVHNDGGVNINTDALTTEETVYLIRNSPTINYNDKRVNQRAIGWINLIVGAWSLHNILKAYVNAITNFVEPNPPTNIVTNDTILTQYSIK